MSPHYRAISILHPCALSYRRNSGYIFGAIQVGLRQLHYVWNVSI